MHGKGDECKVDYRGTANQWETNMANVSMQPQKLKVC